MCCCQPLKAAGGRCHICSLRCGQRPQHPQHPLRAARTMIRTPEAVGTGGKQCLAHAPTAQAAFRSDAPTVLPRTPTVSAGATAGAPVLQAGEAVRYCWFPALCCYLEPHLLGQFISDSE